MSGPPTPQFLSGESLFGSTEASRRATRWCWSQAQRSTSGWPWMYDPSLISLAETGCGSSSQEYPFEGYAPRPH